jgi:hypothetical protein
VSAFFPLKRRLLLNNEWKGGTFNVHDYEKKLSIGKALNKKGTATSDFDNPGQFILVLCHFKAFRMISAEKGFPCAG